MPKVTVERLLPCCSTRNQNVRSLSRRSAGGLPAISAALMAPIDVPITQSGSMPASCIAW
jgi:hypothetical protein